MNTKQEIGKAGEDAAVEYLKNKRYRIIERNYWKPWGELDVIARAPDTTLVFVEVKTIYTNLTSMSNQFINPEDNMTRAKMIKTRRAAEIYANGNNTLVTDRGLRIDLIAVCLGEGRMSNITHYENI